MKSLVGFYSAMGGESLLYHYTSFETVAAYILPSLELQLSPLNRSKDAIESINYFYPLQDVGSEGLEDISEQVNSEIGNNIKIVCFSKDRLDDGEKRPGMMLARMWSQYGENHKGVCLVFSKDKLQHSFEQRFQDECCRIIQDVCYDQIPFTPDNPRLSGSISLEKINGVPTPIQNKFPDLLHDPTIKSIIFSKMSDFRDENEYRFACYDNSRNSRIFFPFHSALKAIILGAKISSVQEEIMIKICKNLNLPNSVILFKEHFRSRRHISKYNFHNPGHLPYIGLRRLNSNTGSL